MCPPVEGEGEDLGAGPWSAQWFTWQSSDWVSPACYPNTEKNAIPVRKRRRRQLLLAHILFLIDLGDIFILSLTALKCLSIILCRLFQISENGWRQGVYGKTVTAGVSVKDNRLQCTIPKDQGSIFTKSFFQMQFLNTACMFCIYCPSNLSFKVTKQQIVYINNLQTTSYLQYIPSWWGQNSWTCFRNTDICMVCCRGVMQLANRQSKSTTEINGYVVCILYTWHKYRSFRYSNGHVCVYFIWINL